MARKRLLALIAAAVAVMVIATDLPIRAQINLTAQDMVEKNVSARGGLQAWRAVQAMSMSGKMPAGGNQRAGMAITSPDMGQGKSSTPQRPAEEVELPFVMDLKRPNKVRIEIEFNGQTAIQIYDGNNGWKLRPFLGRHEDASRLALPTRSGYNDPARCVRGIESSCGALHRGGVAPPERSASHPSRGGLFQSRFRPSAPI